MTNFFYFDQNSQRQGPVNDQQLRALTTQGVINPQTLMETDTGHKGQAGQIPGLFAAPVQPLKQTSVQDSPSNDASPTTNRSPWKTRRLASMGYPPNFYELPFAERMKLSLFNTQTIVTFIVLFFAACFFIAVAMSERAETQKIQHKNRQEMNNLIKQQDMERRIRTGR